MQTNVSRRCVTPGKTFLVALRAIASAERDEFIRWRALFSYNYPYRIKVFIKINILCENFATLSHLHLFQLREICNMFSDFSQDISWVVTQAKNVVY